MNTNENIYKAILGIAIAMLLLSGFMLFPGLGTLFGWLFIIWAWAPFLMLMVVASKVKGSMSAIIVVLITELLISCAGLFIVWQVFSSHEAQAGIIFLFLSGYQLIAAAVGSVVAGVLRP